MSEKLKSKSKVHTVLLSKTPCKNGPDKVCGENNKNFEFIKTIIGTDDIEIRRSGLEGRTIEIIDRYGTHLGNLVQKGFQHVNNYLNKNPRTHEVPEDVIREGFTEATTYVVNEKNKATMKQIKENNIQITVPNGTVIEPRSNNQRNLMLELVSGNSNYIFAVGPAGTGKTFLAVAHAVTALKEKKSEKIILTRPAVEAGESLGFLPGSAEDKLSPYLRPLYDALSDTVSPEKIISYKAGGKIELSSLAYMRGRTLNNCIAILDEAQNATEQQLKMFLTRAGENCTMIISGDPEQVDLPAGVSSGLSDVINDIVNHPDDISKVIQFTGEDVVRSEQVKSMIHRYSRIESPAKNKTRNIQLKQG